MPHIAASIVLGQAVDLPSNVIQVGLTLEVSGRKKGKVRREIEERVLSPYQMVKLKPRGNEYELTVLVEEDEDLSAILAQMEWEMQVLGELDECLVKVKLRPEQEVNGFAPENGVAVDKPEGIELEAVVEEPSNWPRITSAENPHKVARIKLWLMVENGSKFTRGKTKARQEIEFFALSQYQMNKLRKDGNEYELKIPYATDDELQKVVDDVYQEMSMTAYDRNCFIEATMTDMDNEDRQL